MRLLLSLIAIPLTIAMSSEPAAPMQSARHVLTSVERNIDVGDWQISARDTGATPDIPWSVRRQRLHGGKQDGVDLILIDNGRMTLTLVPTRGMGILRVVMGDLRLGWDSPVREVVHPKYVNLEARSGLGWLEREAGRVPRLKPGETRRFAIDVALHTTSAAVATVEEQIKRIQSGRTTQIDRAPER